MASDVLNLRALLEHIQAKLATACGAASPGLRRDRVQTPCAVWRLELSESGQLSGEHLAQFAAGSIVISCVADALYDAADIAEKAWEAFNTSTMIKRCGWALSMEPVNPDDGQGDAERVLTITLQIQRKA